jgi:hypothetical protein
VSRALPPLINAERLGDCETTANELPILSSPLILPTPATHDALIARQSPLVVETVVAPDIPVSSTSTDIIDMFPTTALKIVPTALVPPEPPPDDLIGTACPPAVHMPDHPAMYLPSDPELPPDMLLAEIPEDLDILPVVHAARLHHPTNHDQADIGSNINATADKSILENYTPLAQPFSLLGADASVNGMMCPGYGYFPLQFIQGTVERILMYYCPQLSETLISPQHICAQTENLFSGFDIRCQDMDQASIRFFSPSGLYYADAPLTRTNNLFYFTQMSIRPKAHHLSPLLNTGLWHQHLGHPDMHQLKHLQHCTTGLPTGLHQAIHPLRSCKVCNDARARRNPMGPTASVDDLLPGSHFHLDFGFMRASSDNFQKQKGATRVVTSYDDYNSYLLITCAKTRYTWGFLTASKDPPCTIVQTFLKQFGLKNGYRALRMDQGGELWRSAALRTIVAEAGNDMEPTGSDSPHQNGKVEQLNGTFGVMVRSLLYNAGLPPKYWSAALVHAVHLKNRLWHSALDCTPYEQ